MIEDNVKQDKVVSKKAVRTPAGLEWTLSADLLRAKVIEALTQAHTSYLSIGRQLCDVMASAKDTLAEHEGDEDADEDTDDDADEKPQPRSRRGADYARDAKAIIAGVEAVMPIIGIAVRLLARDFPISTSVAQFLRSLRPDVAIEKLPRAVPPIALRSLLARLAAVIPAHRKVVAKTNELHWEVLKITDGNPEYWVLTSDGEDLARATSDVHDQAVALAAQYEIMWCALLAAGARPDDQLESCTAAVASA